MDLIIAVADPNADDVRALLERHLAFARGESPPEHVHALASAAWADPDLTMFGARRDGELIGVGAIRRLDDTHAELKAMHTRAEARGQGVGQAMLAHLLSVAEARGCINVAQRSMDAFAPARALYRRAGFGPCPPFGPYTVNPYSVCMTLVLYPARRA